VILPVYIARIFAHSTFYARADRDIETPADLRGKRVGTGAYQRTLNVWARGLLEDEYGVSAHEVQWVIRDASDAVNACNRRDMPIEIANTNATLSEMLETGQLDAMIAARPPECFTRGARNVKRLIEDEAQASKEYFRRTELFPILHVMGMRVELARSKPMLARELFGAFAKARNLASVQARESGSWPQEAYSYGLGAPDRKTLATFLSYHHRQGISDRQVALEELFAPLSTQAFGT
jgi:4,5-dihydroxyphthalate decarboxylase